MNTNMNIYGHQSHLIVLNSVCRRFEEVGVDVYSNFSSGFERNRAYMLAINTHQLHISQELLKTIEGNVSEDMIIDKEDQHRTIFRFVSLEGIKKAIWMMELIWKSSVISHPCHERSRNVPSLERVV